MTDVAASPWEWDGRGPPAVQDGHVRAVLWEAPFLSAPGGVFWRVQMVFREALHQGRLVKPVLTIDWIRVPFRDWREVEGQCFTGTGVEGGPSAEFCIGNESVAADFGLAFLHRRGTSLCVSAYLVLPSRSDTMDSPRIVRGEAWLPFLGLLVPDQPGSGADAMAAVSAAARWVDLRGHEPALTGRYLRPVAE